MRIAALAFGLQLAALVVFPVSGTVAAVLGLASVGLLPVLGYRDGSWHALRWALLVPAAALAADVVTFTPVSLQPETDATIYTLIALYYLPAWAVLVLAGAGARRLKAPSGHRTAR